MIEKIQIENFKSLKKFSEDFKNLNLLTGLNGMGKSSLIQVLLLLRQSYFKGLLNSSGIILKGDYIELGTGKDVFYQGAGEDEKISFQFKIDGILNKWIFDYFPERQVLPLNKKTLGKDFDFSIVSLFNNKFQYLNAEHISPKSLHTKSQFDVVESRQLGIHGEYAVHYLVEFGDSEKVEFKNLLHPKAKSEYLIHNVDAWLSEISPGTRLKLENLISIDQAKLGFDFETTNGYTNEFKPVNVGFGLNHILPVLVSLLSAKPNNFIVMENPESHIHPRGQSVLGELLFKASQNDIQLIAETHSDHLLNGIRLEAFKQKKGVERVKIFFFERNKVSEEHYSNVKTPKLDNNGRIDSWPDDFFDQWEKTLIELV